MSEHLYQMAYTLDFEQGPFTKAQLEAKRENASGMLGGADAAVIMSILDLPDGGASHAIFTFDGATGEEVSPGRLFMAFSHLAYALSKQTGLDEEWREIAGLTFQAIRNVLRNQDPDAPLDLDDDQFSNLEGLCKFAAKNAKITMGDRRFELEELQGYYVKACKERGIEPHPKAMRPREERR